MDATAPGAGGFVRRKTVSAHNDATMRTEVSFGESGELVLDEPVERRGAAPARSAPARRSTGLAGTVSSRGSR
jgi:hypothetical protein